MKITLLGTGAAEAIPNPFCSCDVCQAARREGGRHMRARAMALVNEDLLIDLGPDFISAAHRANVYLGNLTTLLITHRHSDHWLPGNLQWRGEGFAPTPMEHLNIYGPSDALSAFGPEEATRYRLSAWSVTAGEHWTAGDPVSYHITAIPATHGGGELEPLLYVVDDGAHRFLYATDTAPLKEAAWDVLRPLGQLDVVILDATSGLRSGGSAHHGLAQFLETRARLFDEGVLGPGSDLVAHHFSHNGGLTHPQLVEELRPYDVTVAYDGMQILL